MKQNDDKTVYIIYGTFGKMKHVKFSSIDIWGAWVLSSDKPQSVAVVYL